MPMGVRVSPSSHSSVTVCKSGGYANLIQVSDMTKPPILSDYGGKLSKRWYVDSYQYGEKNAFG